MRVLAIETASEACSVALFDSGAMLAGEHRVLGRGHAEALIPIIGALPDRGKAERILVSLGPGSFTGVRIGIAAARALGVAWKAQVLGYPTLALIAAMARSKVAQDNTLGHITVCVNGGHGEWFVQDFDAEATPQTALASLLPEQAAQRPTGDWIAGGRALDLAQVKGVDPYRALNLLPDASQAMLLAAESLSDNLAPIYGRAPDAKPQSGGPSPSKSTGAS